MSAPDRVYGFTTPAIGQTRTVSAIRPTARANTYGRAMKDSVKLRSRRGNRDALGRFTGPKNKGHGTRLLEVKKNGYGGAGLPDRVMGFTTPAIGQTREVKALRPTGKHVGTANNYELHHRLEGYSGMPRGAKASTLGHYKKGRDKAAGEFTGKRKVSVKKSEFGRVGKRLDNWVVR